MCLQKINVSWFRFCLFQDTRSTNDQRLRYITHTFLRQYLFMPGWWSVPCHSRHLRIDAHFPADISHLSITEVLWSWHVKVSLQMKIRLIWLIWAWTTNNHLLILITKQTKWKTAFKTDRWWWALVQAESDHYMCVYTCMEVWRCSRLCLSQVGSWVTEGKIVVHRQWSRNCWSEREQC